VFRRRKIERDKSVGGETGVRRRIDLSRITPVSSKRAMKDRRKRGGGEANRPSFRSFTHSSVGP